MVTYTCNRCGEKFISLNDFNAHINKKPKCTQSSKPIKAEENESPGILGTGTSESSQSPGSFVAPKHLS